MLVTLSSKRILIMHKTAPADYRISDVIANRWSPRSFLDRPVEKEKLLHVLEAGRWAASSYGVQPWAYIVATKDEPEEFEKMLSILVPFNQAWANGAPVLMLSTAQMVSADGRPNTHALHDVGAASALMSIEAVAQGLQAHQMSGFDVEKAKEVFDLPEGVAPVAVIALGYVGAPEALPDMLKERELAERVRKPLSEIVFSGKYGSTSELVKA